MTKPFKKSFDGKEKCPYCGEINPMCVSGCHNTLEQHRKLTSRAFCCIPIYHQDAETTYIHSCSARDILHKTDD